MLRVIIFWSAVIFTGILLNGAVEQYLANPPAVYELGNGTGN
jgi:hypothetical protein